MTSPDDVIVFSPHAGRHGNGGIPAKIAEKPQISPEIVTSTL